METALPFLVYSAAFRLSIVAAGTICVVLGYKLFSRGLGTLAERSDASISASAAGTSLTLQNLAPGTTFAAFGMILIVAMILQGNPMFELGSAQPAGPGADGPAPSAATTLRLRGTDERESLSALTRNALDLERQNQIPEAIAAYERALELVAAPANNVAWLYLKASRTSEALRVSEIAVRLRPQNASYLDTYAEALLASGHKSDALGAIREAARLDPRFRDKMSRFGDPDR